jgi:hypothetical protein
VDDREPARTLGNRRPQGEALARRAFREGGTLNAPPPKAPFTDYR